METLQNHGLGQTEKEYKGGKKIEARSDFTAAFSIDAAVGYKTTVVIKQSESR